MSLLFSFSNFLLWNKTLSRIRIYSLNLLSTLINSEFNCIIELFVELTLSITDEFARLTDWRFVFFIVAFIIYYLDTQNIFEPPEVKTEETQKTIEKNNDNNSNTINNINTDVNTNVNNNVNTNVNNNDISNINDSVNIVKNNSNNKNNNKNIKIRNINNNIINSISIDTSKVRL